jgi:hypothetical protein
MGAAFVVIPLAAMIVPIALILLAVLADIVALCWALYRLWHDEWSLRIWDFAEAHVFGPVKRMAHVPIR